MFTVYFLVIVLQHSAPSITYIPQTNKEQCDINAKTINDNTVNLSKGSVYQKATCIVGSLPK